MSIESSLEKIAPLPAVGGVKPVARRPDGGKAPPPPHSFAQHLRGQAAAGFGSADDALAVDAGGPKPGSNKETSTADGDACAEDKPAATAAKPATADDPAPLPQPPSTLSLATASRESDPHAMLDGLKGAGLRGHGLRPAARTDPADAAGGRAAALAEQRPVPGAAAPGLPSADSLSGGPTPAAGSPARPTVDLGLSPSDGSLPSLGAAAGAAPAPVAADAQAATETAQASAELPMAPQSPLFPAALGVQLSTWLRDGVEHAMLELHPRDLGPIEVRIAVRDGATQVDLGADVASTRAALAEALPLLAQQLGDVGLSLAGGSVSDQTGDRARQSDAAGQPGDQRRGSAGAASGRSGAAGDPGLDGLGGPGSGRPQTTRRGLLDLYA